MKKLYYIFVLGCLLIHSSVLAQNNATPPDFDPIQHPIAMEVDTGIIVNTGFGENSSRTPLLF
jgi:hypothetical protein